MTRMLAARHRWPRVIVLLAVAAGPAANAETTTDTPYVDELYRRIELKPALPTDSD